MQDRYEQISSSFLDSLISRVNKLPDYRILGDVKYSESRREFYCVLELYEKVSAR